MKLVKEQVYVQVRYHVWDQVFKQVDGDVREHAYGQLWEQVDDQVLWPVWRNIE